MPSMHFRKTFIRSAILCLLSALPSAATRAAAPKAPDYDHVVLYDMKEDPTLVRFVGEPVVGFYGLQIDEYNGEGTIFYRVGEKLYRSDGSLKVKGSQLTLRAKNRIKIFVREIQTLENGSAREIVYPVECPPAQSGWRYGPSYGRHLIRREDENGVRLYVGSAYLEFQTAQRRCENLGDECGAAGCEEWAGVAVSSAARTGVSKSTTAAVAVPQTLSEALVNPIMKQQDLFTTFKADIDSILPGKLNDLTAMTTSYHTTAFPYHGLTDPIVEQRGLKIGVLTLSYAVPNQTENLVLEIQPLLPEFQSPSPSRCGKWEEGPNKTIFDVRSHPALYIQTPATGTVKESSSLVVCGQSVSVSLQTQTYRSKTDMLALFDALALGQIERVIGPKP